MCLYRTGSARVAKMYSLLRFVTESEKEHSDKCSSVTQFQTRKTFNSDLQNSLSLNVTYEFVSISAIAT